MKNVFFKTNVYSFRSFLWKGGLTKMALFTLFFFVFSVAMAQNLDIVNTLNTQLQTQGNMMLTFLKYLCWIFLAVGIVKIIYGALTNSKRLKFWIISFLIAALALAIGYGAGLFTLT